ncbi:hypothetical protein BJY04DRAFT_219272 [Aspergillus karnatakaensis]|uniref:CFEM domain-containing protein n=1 Tax=Aspergillus karnatakaensis TaxID=1810916 RepID=UPI003CCDC49D
MDDLPACALTCLLQAANASSCALTDPACLCSDSTVNTPLEACIYTACTIKEALTTKRLSELQCGVTPHASTDLYVILSTVFLVLAIICVLLRVAGRVIVTHVGLDDGAVGLALCIAIAIGAIAFPIRDGGLGKDIWHVPFDDITKTVYLFAIATILYPPCIALIKISMLLLYLRLFPGYYIRLATLTTLAITSCWGIIYTLMGVFQCKPREYMWERWDGEHKGQCLDQHAILMSHAIINIVLDVVVIALPLPTLLRLNLSLTKKVGVCMMFVIGLVVTVISILRLTTSMGFLTSSNPTRDFIPVSIWSFLEIDLGIICACLPEIRALIQYLFPSSKTQDSPEPSHTRIASHTTPKSFRLSLSLSTRGRSRGRTGDFVSLQDV